MATFVDLKSLDLILQDCPCGEFTIIGFGHQVRRWKRVDETRVKPDTPCPKCGAEYPGMFEIEAEPPGTTQADR